MDPNLFHGKTFHPFLFSSCSVRIQGFSVESFRKCSSSDQRRDYVVETEVGVGNAWMIYAWQLESARALASKEFAIRMRRFEARFPQSDTLGRHVSRSSHASKRLHHRCRQ